MESLCSTRAGTARGVPARTPLRRESRANKDSPRPTLDFTVHTGAAGLTGLIDVVDLRCLAGTSGRYVDGVHRYGRQSFASVPSSSSPVCLCQLFVFHLRLLGANDDLGRVGLWSSSSVVSPTTFSSGSLLPREPERSQLA